jgi:hypothetical protein
MTEKPASSIGDRKQHPKTTSSHNAQWLRSPDAVAEFSHMLLTASTPEDILQAIFQIIDSADAIGLTILLTDGSSADRALETVNLFSPLAPNSVPRRICSNRCGSRGNLLS